LDIVKAVIPCLIGWWVLGGQVGFDIAQKKGFLGFSSNTKIGIYVAGVSVIVGHIFPIYFKFKGGKGIASTIGILLLACPLVTIAAFCLGLIYIKLTNVGSITSFIVIGIPIVYQCFVERLCLNNTVEPILLFCLFCLTFLAHRKNIIKLFSYTEKPVVKNR
jgi:glycerol-3-phosphate acyltransferase PlsY